MAVNTQECISPIPVEPLHVDVPWLNRNKTAADPTTALQSVCATRGTAYWRKLLFVCPLAWFHLTTLLRWCLNERREIEQPCLSLHYWESVMAAGSVCTLTDGVRVPLGLLWFIQKRQQCCTNTSTTWGKSRWMCSLVKTTYCKSITQPHSSCDYNNVQFYFYSSLLEVW